MKKLTAIVMLLLAAVVIAQDQPVKMPPLIEQADARYEKIVAEAQAVRLKVYEKALADATRARNVELAQAIEARMKEIGLANTQPRIAFIPASLTWTEAHAAAERMGGTLLVIKDAETLKLAMSATGGRSAWVGAHDQRWIDGSPIPAKFWGENQPDNMRGREPAVMLNYKGEGLLWDVPNDYAIAGYLVERR